MVVFTAPMMDGLMDFLRDQEEFVFLDTSRPDSENFQSMLFVDPIERLVCRAGDDLLLYLNQLHHYLEEGYYLAGWVGYEFGALLEGGIKKNLDKIISAKVVLADFGVFLEPRLFNHLSGESDFPDAGEKRQKRCNGAYSVSNLHPNMTKEEFVSSLKIVQDYIAAGDTYQVNYTMKLLFDFEGDVESFYTLLRKNQSVGYGAFIRSRNENVLSFSPELFFRKNDSEITVRPMKGTASRGRHNGEESENMHFLKNDIKNRSENVMIVDLLRNDLARLMHGHGQSRVFVESLFDVESYESLLQMTSTIKAECPTEKMQNLALTELFRALFPCGSITGAPKIRTMQIIDELEKEQRGVYTGAIGYLGPVGQAAFNVPIRTVRLKEGKGEMGIGAGITHDSVPEEEWDESLLKGHFLTRSNPEFQLFETLLFLPKVGYFLEDAHLRRLCASADYFKFSFDEKRAKTILSQEKERFDNRPHRVRLALAKDGRLEIKSVSCTQPATFQLPKEPDHQGVAGAIAFADEPVDTFSPWCFHKTTRREIYNRYYSMAQEQGLFDYIFSNENAEITEGCITNIFIFKDGQYFTPPLESGLLAGVMRQEILAETTVPVTEQVLSKEDVANADAVFLSNSVRGVVRVEITGDQ